jgi:hypothetical protein
VTQAYFERIQTRNIEMLKYSEGEPTEEEKRKVYSHDLSSNQNRYGLQYFSDATTDLFSKKWI